MKLIKHHYIYRITNLLNGKIYIGQTINPKNRWKAHQKQNASERRKQFIARAIDTHGKENFIFEIVASGIYQCTCQYPYMGQCRLDINQLEDDLINQYDSSAKNGKGYNVARGGQSGPVGKSSNKGVHSSPETEFKPKIIWPSNEELAKLVNKQGVTHTAQTLGINSSSLCEHMQKRGIKHNRKRGHDLGSKHPNAKINEEQVLEILRLCESGDYNYTTIANKLQISRSCVAIVMNGSAWSHITGFTNPKDRTIPASYNHKVKRNSVKLTVEQVLNVVKLHNENKYSTDEIAQQFNVSRQNINCIINGRTWSHITNITYVKDIKYHVLNERDVLEIIRLYNEVTAKKLAEQFNVTLSTIRAIVSGQNWSHVTGIKPKK
jgi:group I intron endonuclease